MPPTRQVEFHFSIGQGSNQHEIRISFLKYVIGKHILMLGWEMDVMIALVPVMGKFKSYCNDSACKGRWGSQPLSAERLEPLLNFLIGTVK